MNIRSFFTFGRKKTDDQFHLEKVNKQKITGVGEAAAGNLTAAANNLAEMMAQQNSVTKILLVQDGEHSTALVDYSVKMAQKLDCEILSLDVTDEPLNYSGERKEREVNRFYERTNKNAETIQLKAEAMGVTHNHVVKIGSQEETIKALSQNDKSIRYVLIKPEQERLSVGQKQPRVPVVDLNCSTL